ncbi:MAG: PilX N-terminal domain-containing pilus assembly protein [Burkholderiaceae bacterium]|nr:PilX N-terminal domain-containing pilus assembly protein [Burkholderiaceae bacterium]
MDKRNFLRRPATVQRGAAALVVTMLLLFGSSIIVFYLNRGLIFEQKTSANQLRSTIAFETAEAGIEWATGMLNTESEIAADCTFSVSTTATFRARYILPAGNAATAAVTNTYPGCKVNGTALTCGCPLIAGVNDEAVAALGTAVQPGFTVTFANVPGDTTSVRVTSTGCTAQAGACKPLTVTTTPAATNAATTNASDAWAQVSVIMKLRPLLRAAPSAALTCGTSCAVGGSYEIVNTEVASNGYLVNAGTTITSGAGTTYQTIPGQPIQNALIPADASLSALAASDPSCSASAMFKAYFGTTMAEYAASTQVKTIPNCTVPAICGTLVNNARLAGAKSFYFPDGLSLNNSAPFTVLGDFGAGNGVNIVSPGDINLNGNITIHGLLFSNSTNTDDLGTGSINIYGSIVTCAGYNNNGSGLLSYDSNALGGQNWRPGPLVRVPGSWRDFTP